MKKLLLAILLASLSPLPVAAQNPTSRIVKRSGFVAGVRGDIFVNSSTGVTYMCKSASCTSGGSGWGSMDAGGLLPESDATAFVKGSSDSTKQLRFEVDGFTTGTTRVATFPNADITVARTDAAQTFTGAQTMGGGWNVTGSASLGFHTANMLRGANVFTIGWDSGAITSGLDTGVARAAAKVLEINGGTAGTAGVLLLRGQTFASLPASPVAGMHATVTDSSTATWGATITGGGANIVHAFYNGTNWVVN